MEASDLEELAIYVARSSGLDPAQAKRLVDDVLSYLSESVDEFVRRRHAVLLRLGRRNPEIYTTIAAELAGRRFPPPSLSIRQIRRMIYG